MILIREICLYSLRFSSEQATFRHPLRYGASLKGVSARTILLSLLLIRYPLLHSPSFQLAIPPYCFFLPSYFAVTIADCFDDCNVLCSYSSPGLLDLRQLQSQPLALMITWRRPIANLLQPPTASHPNLAFALFPSAGIFTQSSICVCPSTWCDLMCFICSFPYTRVCWCASTAFPYTCWALMYPITNTAVVRRSNSLELTWVMLWFLICLCPAVYLVCCDVPYACVDIPV